MQDILLKLNRSEDLTPDEITRAFDKILKTDISAKTVGEFLLALSKKGEKAVEIAAAATYLRNHVSPVKAPPNAVDCCGTGGDVSGTYNISTAVALICAACDIPVAKHGNRAASSKSGAADVLEALGVNIEADRGLLEDALQKFNFAFLMAPKHHQVLKPLAPIRKSLGVPTIFNLLGPLANPAGTKVQLIGVYNKKWCRPIAEALKLLGTDRAYVVHGRDGLDEITLTDRTDIVELKDSGEIVEYVLSPEDFNLQKCNAEELKGGDASQNAKALQDLLEGQSSAYRDIALLNAACVLKLSNQNLSNNDAMSLVTEALESGRVLENFNDYKSFVGGNS